jgi:protein-tyrosine phosphatase
MRRDLCYNCFGGYLDDKNSNPLDLVHEEENGFKLYVGSKWAAQDLILLKAHSISHVVMCLADFKPPFATEDVLYHELPIDDEGNDHEADPRSLWPAAMKFMDEVRAQGQPILVHCMWGMNRSVSTTAVYLCHAKVTSSISEALSLIKRSRKLASPQDRYVKWAKLYVSQYLS